jgi:hypothetical protein
MVSTHERRGSEKVCTVKLGAERRRYRRHDLEHRGLPVFRWQGYRPARLPDGMTPASALGTLIDLSAGGARIVTSDRSIRPESHIRVRLELPEYAGITAFIDTSGEHLAGKREWIGWMTVRRVVERADGQLEVAGPLEDMAEVDRGMLGLYLSTQPMAA